MSNSLLKMLDACSSENIYSLPTDFIKCMVLSLVVLQLTFRHTILFHKNYLD